MDDPESAEHVRRHVQQAQKRGAEIWQDDRLTRLRRDSEDPSTFSGPTATIFAIWWHHLTAAMHLDFGNLASLHPRVPVVVEGQEYLLDFEVSLSDPFLIYVAELRRVEVPRIAVALIAADQAERSELVAARRERDRALQSAGWVVFQFTDSEVHHAPEGCVREVMDASKPILEAFRRRALHEAFEAVRPNGRTTTDS